MLATRPSAAGAADGDHLVLGVANEAINQTLLRTKETALHAVSATDDGALVGENTAADGYGVRGTSPYIGVNAVGGEIGVYAVSDYGAGVNALTYDGTALLAETAVDAGAALDVRGRARFSRSGRLVVPAGSTAATQTGISLDSTSLVLAVLQKRRGDTHVVAAVPEATSGSFTVFLNRAVTRDTEVAWFVVN